MIEPEEMLWELTGNYLEVVLVPAREQRHAGHSVRAVQYQNAAWYRKFCSLYSSNRKGTRIRTRIKRQATIRALERIIDGETSGIYVTRLLEFIESENKAEAERTRRLMQVRQEPEVLEWCPF